MQRRSYRDVWMPIAEQFMSADSLKKDRKCH